MVVHRDNQEVYIIERNGESFPVRVSHVEDHGHHTLVISTDQENLKRLEGLRGEIASMLKEEHGIRNSSDLTYAELHPNVEPLYQVNVDKLGPGLEAHEKSDQLEEHGQFVEKEQIQEELGEVQMPDTPTKETFDLKNAEMPRANMEEMKQQLQTEEQKLQQNRNIRL